MVFVPALTLALFLAPIGLGLIGTWAPAIGYLPALGGTALSLDPWRQLAAAPGLAGAVRLTLVTGFLSTALALALAFSLLAAWHGRPAFDRFRRLLGPLLAMPHAALAIGLAFLLSPSGWLARIVSPWATGWQRPPDLLLVQDPHGLALTLGLVLKEAPFLLLMGLAALNQIDAGRSVALARTAGYGPTMAWAKTVLPRLYPLVRLPVYAVLAYSLSVVDMAMILGPATPPPLAPLVLRWFDDPDLGHRFMAAAGACLQFALVAGAIAAWHGVERLVARLARPWLSAGGRGGGGALLRLVSGTAGTAAIAAAGLSVAALALWSLARRWRFPDALPGEWSLGNWMRSVDGLAPPAVTTLSVGLAATLIALALAVGCLEYERRAGIRPTTRALWLLYTPLLVPQIAFLFGIQVFLVAVRLDGSWLALTWSHLLFVLPYVFLSLADPWRRLDERYRRIGACLGAGPARVFWRITVPMLLRPILVAGAVGFSVSVAQYLPTLFAGAGRLSSLTTEAVGLAAGADRRVAAVFAFAQMALPSLGFMIALAVPAMLYRHRRGLQA
ncbi:MAG: ABC transporter permease [Inquilinus sp.]|nr:ABC transporter permease [Inquilinus sp.]